jgi:diguanylate cyclase (GGDEF)-like protein
MHLMGHQRADRFRHALGLIVSILVLIVLAGQWGLLPDPVAIRRHMGHQPYGGLLLVVGGIGLAMYAATMMRIEAILVGQPLVPNQLGTALDAIATGIIVTDHHQQVVLINRALRERMGWYPQQWQGQSIAHLPWLATSHGNLTTAAIAPWIPTANLQDRNAATWSLRDAHDQPRSVTIQATALPSSHRYRSGAILCVHDHTIAKLQREQMESMLRILEGTRSQIQQRNEQLTQLATRDPLTGCLQRSVFIERGERLLDEAKDQRTSICCAMIDIDHFKQINDQHGHATGDRVLRKIGEMLRLMMFEDGLLARYGGEEFIAIWPPSRTTTIHASCECMRSVIGSLRFSQPAQLRVTASIGLVRLVPQPHHSIDDLIAAADQCLYQAKANGRNQTIFAKLPNDRLPSSGLPSSGLPSAVLVTR